VLQQNVADEGALDRVTVDELESFHSTTSNGSSRHLLDAGDHETILPRIVADYTNPT
jgi:hypothetical protein